MSATTKIADLHRRKLDRRFDLLDQDRSGYLSKDNYDSLVARLLAAYGQDSRSATGADVTAGYDRLWQGLARVADIDADGRISRQEFLNAVSNGVLRREGGLDTVLESLQKAILRLADS